MQTTALPLKAKHFIGANYDENCDCPFARAANDYFGIDTAVECVGSVIVDGSMYEHESYTLNEFEEDMPKAAQVEDKETIIRTVTLTKVVL
jgi:hypothetical protein